MNQPIGLPKQTAKIKQGTPEENSAWVAFPKGQYLLPIVSRGEKLVPQIDDEGNVTLRLETKDPLLAEMVGKLRLASITDGEVAIEQSEMLVTPTFYADFIKLLRHLVITNYEMTKDEVMELLTFSHREFASMIARIMVHVGGK